MWNVQKPNGIPGINLPILPTHLQLKHGIPLPNIEQVTRVLVLPFVVPVVPQVLSVVTVACLCLTPLVVERVTALLPRTHFFLTTPPTLGIKVPTLCLVSKESSPGILTWKRKGPILLLQAPPLGPSTLTVISLVFLRFLQQFLIVVSPTGRARVTRQLELLFAYKVSKEVAKLKTVLTPTSDTVNPAPCPPKRH